MSLFNTNRPPLAERVRPRTLDEYIGQRHLLGDDGPLKRLLAGGQLPSILFWGPPGVGKTTLARLVARAYQRPFESLSAVQSGVQEVRNVLTMAKRTPGMVLFIDEIHRFNKAQQDALLQAVESGLVTLIGATTENPSFEVIRPLLSRCQVYVLEAHTPEDIRAILQRALQEDEVLQQRKVELIEIEAIYRISGGDARKALNLLELTLGLAPAGEDIIRITDAAVMAAAHQKVAQYDKDGEQHYDIISAFIKSVRGGDPNGALYWLARMLEGGENIRFIARRLIILASEDIGNANPNALLLATAAFQACDVIGMPEARIILAQCTNYLATSPKSNASYASMDAAFEAVRQHPDLPVPMHLRNAPTRMMKNMGYGNGYKYSHSFSDEESRQDYLPEALRGTRLYEPKMIGKEKEIKQFLQLKWGDWYGY